LINTAWTAEAKLDNPPKTIPIVALFLDATAAEALDEAWFGSNMTPEKKPEVTTSAAVSERAEGYDCGYEHDTGVWQGRGRMGMRGWTHAEYEDGDENSAGKD
jgi:hypothetical protein